MGVVDDSAEDPMSELWGLFKSDDDVSWQHKALCSQTDPEAFSPKKAGRRVMRNRCAPAARCASNACNGIEHDERFGIWGGLSERERRRYKKEHKERA